MLGNDQGGARVFASIRRVGVVQARGVVITLIDTLLHVAWLPSREHVRVGCPEPLNNDVATLIDLKYLAHGERKLLYVLGSNS